jgi:hypothetical protein
MSGGRLLASTDGSARKLCKVGSAQHNPRQARTGSRGIHRRRGALLPLLVVRLSSPVSPYLAGHEQAADRMRGGYQSTMAEESAFSGAFSSCSPRRLRLSGGGFADPSPTRPRLAPLLSGATPSRSTPLDKAGGAVRGRMGTSFRCHACWRGRRRDGRAGTGYVAPALRSLRTHHALTQVIELVLSFSPSTLIRSNCS